MSTPRVDLLRSETQIFEEPSYDVSIVSTTSVEVFPQSAIKNETSPIVFFIKANDTGYIDLKSFRLYIRGKITDDKGNNQPAIAATDVNVSDFNIVNNFVDSCFDKVTVHINEVEVGKTTGYPYIAYIEHLLGRHKDYHKTLSEAGLFFKTKTEKSKDDDGFKKRKALVTESKMFEGISNVNCDLFRSDKYLPPTLDMRVTFYHTGDEFRLISTGTAPKKVKFELDEAKLLFERHYLQPSINLSHLQVWRKHPVALQIPNTVFKSYGIAKDTRNVTNEQILSGPIPNYVLVALVQQKSYAGSFDTNPYVFDHHGLASCSLTINSDQVTTETIEIDVADGKAVQAYVSLMKNLLADSECQSPLDLSLEEFKAGGKLFYCFNIRKYKNEMLLPAHGNCAITLKFKADTTETLSALVYASYSTVLHITKDKNVFFRE
jgi:hypothetical protein